MGPVETLVLEAWGVGIRIDTDIPEQQAKLVSLIHRAREIDDNEGRCGDEKWHMGYNLGRCELPRGHEGEHALAGRKEGT